MFLVEKDIIIETNPTSVGNVTNIITASSITNIVDADRYKFETFADALWWGIVRFLHDKLSFSFYINLFFYSYRSHYAR